METTIYKTKTTSRFLLTMKKYIMENRRSQLLGVGAFLGFCILIGVWCGFMDIDMYYGFTVFYYFFAMLFCMVCTSLMFSDMGTKEGKIRLLMTPASAADVFFTRLLFAIPVVLVIVYIGYLLMGYSNILVYYCRNDVWVTLPNLVGIPDSERVWYTQAMFGDVFLFNEALFVLGAVLWPRMSFIKTAGLYAVLNIVLSMLLLLMKDVIGLIITHIITGGIEMVAEWTVFGLMLALDIAIIWFAYYRYKRVQLK